MEDALAPNQTVGENLPRYVLILVLMEDALAPILKIPITPTKVCLNPCFNGRCTRTIFTKKPRIFVWLHVLILVLMEDALAQVAAVSILMLRRLS